ncbi:MAG: tRNA (adenosine(37)-N6)-threonylcarbamoyltransferase complex dimerization subunit type 1 TsaB [Bacteroidales bacterium]|nr:tRNA (adenosine(37)-N6)-threonylcarbamoyltransferase complex dimerization subunit type 1 TsaB [Bacteroidales bacterium]
MILCIETSTKVCSVALVSPHGPVAVRESDEGKSHASLLTIFIKEILSRAGIEAKDLDAVAVSKGPGSYTGLRIGVSVAKGITYAVSVPLIGIETTHSMFYGIDEPVRHRYNAFEDSLFVPMLDARRMEVYYSVFDSKGSIIKEVRPEIITSDHFMEYPEKLKIFIFGDGAEKCKPVLKRKNIIFIDEYRITASHMYIPAYEAFYEKKFEDIAYFEPFYFKDFIATRPGRKISGK